MSTRKRTKGTATEESGGKPRNKRIKIEKEIIDTQSQPSWTSEGLLSELHHLTNTEAKNILSLLENENTIPFICRYRRHLIGNRGPEEMRDIESSITSINALKSKIQNCIKSLEKSKKLDNDLKQSLLSARSFEEIDVIYGPYKVTKKTLADKACELGLELPFKQIFIEGIEHVDLKNFIKKSIDGLKDTAEVMTGLKNITIDHIFKNKHVLKTIREAIKNPRIRIESSKSTKTCPDQEKFQNYWKFSQQINFIRPHQVLAINRGENLKALTVKIVFPDFLINQIKSTVRDLFMKKGKLFRQRTELFEESWTFCYSKKIQPSMSRLIRADLSKNAEKESILVFGRNLKQLLLTRPVKGEKIFGIDPGFKHGCKCALISEQNELLFKTVMNIISNPEESAKEICNTLKKFDCKLVAIGNGKGCREVESWMSKLVSDNRFHDTNVRYCIINEQGASIYSCSPEAKKEFPNLDINLISAVSIARRLSDPLAEYVKIEPKHLGVGMYQHDVNEKQLTSTLNQVVSECVSEVGVDLNTTSESLLQHICGLTQTRAKKIIEYRTKNGTFKSREELMKISGIGEKTFTQCAGFIRIEEETSSPNPNYNILDATWIHPESYKNTKLIIKYLKLNISNIGKKIFIDKIKNTKHEENIEKIAIDLKMNKNELLVIMTALEREIFSDYRTDVGSTPLFRVSVKKMLDLKIGEVLTGVVTNVTHFGSFVDLGVEKDGLIHSSNLNGLTLGIGDHVEVNVVNLDIQRGRINLKLNMIL